MDNFRVLKRMILTILAIALISIGFGKVAYAKNSDDILGQWMIYDELDGKYVATIEFKKNSKNNTYFAQVVKQGTTHSDYRTTCADCPKPFTGKPIEGIIMVWNMKADPKDEHKFVDGYGLDPWNGDYFQGSARLSGDALRVRGSMLGASWLSQHFTWKRAK